MRLKCTRLVCILLALLMGCMPFSRAEEAEETTHTNDLLPTLHVSVQYEEPSPDGIISGTVTVECQSPRSPLGTMTEASDVVVTIETETGLTLLEGAQDTLSIGDIACGSSHSFSLSVKYDPALVKEAPPPGEDIMPLLRITADSKAVGGCRYTCLFDITPKPRALLLGMNTSSNLLDAWQLVQTLNAVEAFFTPLYYDGQPMQTTTILSDIADPAGQSFSAAMETLKSFPTDENDVTYLYLNACTARNAQGNTIHDVAVREGMKIVSMTYAELFSRLKDSVKGRLVVLVDSAWADDAVSAAASAGLDAEKTSVIGLRISPDKAAIPDGFQLQGVLGAALCSWEGEFATAQGLAQTLECEEQTENLLRLLTGSPARGVWFGDDGNVLFASTPEYRSKVFLLAVVEEEAIPYSVIGSVVLTAEISEYDIRSAYTLVVTPTIYIDGYPEATETFNSVLHSNAVKALDNAAVTRTDEYYAGYPRHEYEFTVTSVYANSGVVSVVLDTHEYYSGGAHGGRQMSCYNFSPEKGWFIELGDMLDPEEPQALARLRTLLINQLTMHYEKLLWEEMSPEAAAAIALDEKRAGWYLTQDGLVICYNEYQIGPYSIGRPSVTIPWAQLKHVLDRKYLPYELPANGLGGVALPGDARLQSEIYTGYGEPGRPAFVAEGTLAEVRITYVSDSLIDNSMIFYANGLCNAWVSLPHKPDSIYRIDWYSDGAEQSIYTSVNQ